MKRLLLITSLIPLLFVSGCRSARETMQVSTQYEAVYQRDSVYVDCTDTIFVEKSGDSVRILEKITEKEYHYTVFRDTLRSRDTLIVEKSVTMAATELEKSRKPRRLGWFFAGMICGVFLLFAVKIVLKIFAKR